ncbi:MAG TPA: hypothetical protein VJV79_37425 [Polyangiaceae bacterium]|nr:hypothetical protein [Polyangiaceae bacterium]
MSKSEMFRAQPGYLPTALLCLAVLANACSSDPLHAPTQAVPIAGCEMLDIVPCDTLQTDCQQSRLELAACLRETTAVDLPRITVMTEQAYVDYLKSLYEGRELVTNHFEIAMTWLGLAQPGSFSFVPPDEQKMAEWFGTYRWRQKDVLIIDHGKPADDQASNVALVAALIRSLRDRDINIGMWTTEVAVFDVDSNWGADAMYFGESRFFSNRYQAALDGLDSSRLDEFAQINDSIREDIAWIRTQSSPYVATNDRFPHNFGARATYLAWQRGGVDAVNALYHDKLITHQLMASETVEAPAPTLKYHTRPRAPEEWDQLPIVTALGAWGLYLSLSQNLESDAAWSLALNWSGEQLFAYKAIEPSLDTALVWQLEMADEASASALEAALLLGTLGAQVQRIGTFVTLAIATNQDPLDWAFVAD